MAKAGSVIVAVVAVMLGLFLGYVGLTFVLQGGDLASGSSESSTFLGLFGESKSQATMPAEPWLGFVFLIGGGAILLFGLRALYVAFEGRSDVG